MNQLWIPCILAISAQGGSSFSPEAKDLPYGAPTAWAWNTAGLELIDKP